MKSLWLLTIVTDDIKNIFMSYEFDRIIELYQFIALNDKHNIENCLYEIEKVIKEEA